MAKTDTPRRRRRQSKVVSDEIVEEDNVNNEGQTEAVSSSEQIVETEKDAPTEITDKKQEKDQDEQDSQMDTDVIEVKGSAPTVTVSWKKKNDEEGESDDLEKTNCGSDQMAVKETMACEAQTQADSSADAPECSSHNERPETKMENIKEKQVNGKRKARSNAETSPSKKPKLINDGFCLFVGNLNKSKTVEEVRDSLSDYLKTQGLLVQDIRLDRSKKYAYVDLASEMDLTKALKLNGDVILDNPMKIAKAKVKSEDKVKTLAVDKKAKDARCLFLKNVPYNATKEDILKVFHKAVAIRFPGGAEGPSKGIAFVEFKNETTARKVWQKKQGVKIQGRVLIVDFVGETSGAHSSQVTKADDDNNDTKAPPNDTLFVGNLSYNVTEEKLKKVFQEAVNVNIPQSSGKSRGFAFVEFATVTDAEKALQSSQKMKICKRTVRVHFCKKREKPEKATVQSKTLIIIGLAEKTTAETLKSAFEWAVSARVAVDKATGVSKRFGFVDFESEENCKAVKEAMEDCEIDGIKVTVDFAKSKTEEGHQGAKGGLVGRPAGQAAGRGAGRGGRGGQGGRGAKGRKGGRGHGAGTVKDAVKEEENKG